MAYPSVADFKNWRNIDGGGEDAEITWMVAASIAQVERETGRKFVGATVTYEFPVSYPFVTRQGRRLTMFKGLVSATTVTNGDGTVLVEGTDFDFVPYDGPPFYQIEIRNSSSERWQTDADGTRISIAGSWGFSADVPDDLFVTILQIIGFNYAGRADGAGTRLTPKGQVIDSGQWSDSIKRVIDSYRRVKL